MNETIKRILDEWNSHSIDTFLSTLDINEIKSLISEIDAFTKIGELDSRTLIYHLGQYLDFSQLVDLIKSIKHAEALIRVAFNLFPDEYKQKPDARYNEEQLFEILKQVCHSAKLAKNRIVMIIVSLVLDPIELYDITHLTLAQDQYRELLVSTENQDVKNILALCLENPELCEKYAQYPLNDFEVEVRLVRKSSSSEAAFYFLQHYNRLLLEDTEKQKITQLLSLDHLHKLSSRKVNYPNENYTHEDLVNRLFSNVRVNFSRYVDLQLRLFSKTYLMPTNEEIGAFLDFTLNTYIGAFNHSKRSEKWSWVNSMQIEKIFDIVRDDNMLELYWGNEKWQNISPSNIIKEGILTRIESPLLVTKLYEFGWDIRINPELLGNTGNYIPPDPKTEEGLDRIFDANFSIEQNMRSWNAIRQWDIPESFYFKKFNQAIHEGKFALAKFCEPATQNRESLADLAKNENVDELARYTSIILLNEDSWFEYGFLNLENTDYRRSLLEKINDPFRLVKLRLMSDDTKWSVIITKKVNRLKQQWIEQLFLE